MDYDFNTGNDLQRPDGDLQRPAGGLQRPTGSLERPAGLLKVQSGLFKLLLLTFILSALNCCSLSSSSTARSARLSPLESADISFELIEINRDPKVYRVKNPQLPDSRLFLAALQECNIVRSEDSVTSVVRQLFVGLEKLQIEQQTKLLIKEHIFHAWQASAMLDEQHIKLVTFSISRDSCIMDYVFWSNGADAEQLSLDVLKDNFQDFLRSEIKKRKW